MQVEVEASELQFHLTILLILQSKTLRRYFQYQVMQKVQRHFVEYSGINSNYQILKTYMDSYLILLYSEVEDIILI